MNSEINNKKLAQKILNDLEGIDLPNIRNMKFYPEWISIKDRLPDHDDDYICYAPNWNRMQICNFEKSKALFWTMAGYKALTITHWMPLPFPPEPPK